MGAQNAVFAQEQMERDNRRAGIVQEFTLPRRASLEEQVSARSREAFPEGHARKELSARGIEAFRIIRKMSVCGAISNPGDTLLLWPLTPVEGFATKEQLAGVPNHDKDIQPDGSIKLLTGLVVAGKRYREGSVIQQWPEKPLPGFITARHALEMLTGSDIEPAELSPA